MRVKWNSAISQTFNTSNGVSQGGVLPSIRFHIYLEQFILSLNELRVGCYLHGMFVGVFSYAAYTYVTLLLTHYRKYLQTAVVCKY